jgi:hypothetical protein
MMPSQSRFSEAVTQIGGYGWSALAILLLTTTLTSAQTPTTYIYRTVDVPFIGAVHTQINGLTDLGTMSGIYGDTQGKWRSWVYRRVTKTFVKVTQPGKPLWVEDIDANQKMVGYYHDTAGGVQSFFKKNSVFHTIRGPNGEAVYGCTIAITDGIICTYDDTVQGKVRGLVSNGSVVTHTFDLEAHAPYGWQTLGINDYRDIVGYIQFYEHTSGFLLTSGDFHTGEPSVVTVFDAPCGGSTLAMDVNNDLLMAVTCWNQGHTSYVTDGVTYTEIAMPEGVETHVRRINRGGQVAGYYIGVDGREHGFIGTPTVNLAAR